MRELTAREVRYVCDPAMLGLRTTAEMTPTPTIIGQARALEALKFGLGIQHPGFNIYVAGPPGTGKRTAIDSFLAEVASEQPTPPDLCYVYNFKDPYRPQALLLPPGLGRALQEDMRTLINTARTELPRLFESDEYSQRQGELQSNLEQARNTIIAELNHRAHQQGFTIQSSPMGILLVPLREDQPMSEQEFQALAEEEQGHLRALQGELDQEVKAGLKEIRRLQQEAQAALTRLNRGVVLNLVGGLVEDLQEKYQAQPAVLDYLLAVEEDIVENIEQFLPIRAEAGPQQPGPAAGGASPRPEAALRRYEVNVMVSRKEGNGAPIVHERNASYTNLFGRIEKEAVMGALHTDFTLIRPGSLHEANGGYLILPLQELLLNPLSYDSLKRAIRNREIAIDEPMERLGLMATRTLRPQPVPLNVKVILLGSPFYYYTLYGLDEDFRELFRVRADFDSRMERTEEGLQRYCSFVSTLTDKEGLRPLTAAAVARLVEEGSRLAEHQEKLSTHFAELSDIVREGDYWAGQERSPLVDAAHIRKAVSSRIYRSSLLEERIREAIEKGTILVDTEGAVVGQVNGLVVLQMGDYSFGRPSRITATAGIGQAGLIDIEREARLGGPIHTKGVLILSGYLTDRFARNGPLSLSARLVFEQSYEGVEGDSASGAELYALLSELAELPISQAIAVTGSVNQRGEVQAIGGVNQKIEGFFDVCRLKGLSGRQGVIIPQANIQNLMLRDDVAEAVRSGQFHVWAASTIAEGIELLTGVPAGELGPDGAYPPGTVNQRVQARLQQMREAMRRHTPAARDGRGDDERPTEER